jgi:hypothetical protein
MIRAVALATFTIGLLVIGLALLVWVSFGIVGDPMP